MTGGADRVVTATARVDLRALGLEATPEDLEKLRRLVEQRLLLELERRLAGACQQFILTGRWPA